MAALSAAPQPPALAATPAADAPVNVWQKAIDKELVSSGLGDAGEAATKDDTKWALHQLICWHIDVATNPATNGGKALIAAAAPVVLPEPDAAAKAVMASVDAFGTASRIDTKDAQIFGAMPSSSKCAPCWLLLPDFPCRQCPPR